MLNLGTEAPDFEAQTNHGPIKFHQWLGDSWGVLFSYPKAFTSVCGEELVAVARQLDSYESAGVKLAMLSLDTAEDQQRWADELGEEQSCPARLVTQIADPNAQVASLYGMVHPETHADLAMRVLYIVDPARKVRLALAYPPPVARNFKELLGVIKTIRDRDARG